MDVHNKMDVHISKISPIIGKIEGGEYIRIIGNGFNKDMICKFGSTQATTFYSDSNNLFCKSPQSENLKECSVPISLCCNNKRLNPDDNLIKFEYVISIEKIYLEYFIKKLKKAYKYQYTPETKIKIEKSIDHTQEIVNNLEKLQSNCTLNENLITLKREFQDLMVEISSISNSKVVEKNPIDKIVQKFIDLKINICWALGTTSNARITRRLSHINTTN